MPTPDSITLKAWAKLNLALSVGPPVPPRGYHPIASWFAPIALHDEVTVKRLADGEPSRHEVRWAADAPHPTPIDWPIEKDLAVRAHRLLEREADRPLPIAMTVAKRTPVGGGLGGGSSDAASALMAINRLHRLKLGADRLRTLSMELGSDIAFFLDEPCVEARTTIPRAALVTGFGESLERSVFPRGQLLLFFPPFGCPTAPVYKAFDSAPAEAANEARLRRIIDVAVRTNGGVHEDSLFNDLGVPACTVEPRLQDVWCRLQRACGADATVHLTGSGSTLFAIGCPHLAWACKKAAPECVVLESAFISA